MPVYRYFTADVRTGVPVMELAQYGVTMDKQLSGAGNYSGFIRLGTGIYNDALLLEGTQPGLHALMVQRDGVNIWGGPIWSRTYAAQGQTLQLNAATFESIFDHVIMAYDQIYENIAQHTILSTWLTQLMGQTDCNFNLTQDIAYDGNYFRSILVPAYEYHMASDVLSQMIGIENGIYYNINLAAAGDNPTRTFYARCGVQVANYVDSGAYYDFPGTVGLYWMNEQGVKTAKYNVALGAGTGNQILRSGVLTSGMSAYPMWGATESFPDIGDNAGLLAKATTMSRLRKPPIYNPTFQLGTESGFDGWNKLGQMFTVSIQDARFPLGLVLKNRMLGWSLTPQSKDGSELIQFTLESDS